MTLMIRKFNTLCRSPRGCERAGVLADDAARGLLSSELTAQLGPSLDRLPAVVRVRRLQVKLKIPARQLTAAKLAEAWARGFALALHRALAYPENDGVHGLRRHETQAAYKAAMLHHLITEGLASGWQFPELEQWRNSSPSEAALGILLDPPGLAGETLAQMARIGWLEPLLTCWDEHRLEQMIHGIAQAETKPADLSLEDLLELGRSATASGGLQPQWSISSRRQAVRLWLRMSRRFPLRAVWHGLRLLRRLLEMPPTSHRSIAAVLSDPIPFPKWCHAILRAAWPDALLLAEGTVPPLGFTGRENKAFSHKALERALSLLGGISASSSLNSVLDELRSLTPSAANPKQPGKWTISECAGVLLLLSIVRRKGLWQLAREPEFVAFGGRRAFSFFLAAVAMTLLGGWSPGDPVESAACLFAGILVEEDRAGMLQFFAQSDVHAISAAVREETWAAALEALAADLTCAFAQRIRGFRQASREAVVRQFVRIAGRVLVEEQRLLVVLDPSPWAVALHISGADEPLEGVEWIGQRRVEFVLEGL